MAIRFTFNVFVDSCSKARIFPPFGVAAKGEDIEFANYTEDVILVQMKKDSFGLAQDEWKALDKKSDANTHKHAKAVGNGAKAGALKFRVFCAETGTFAEAASDPEIIIEP